MASRGDRIQNNARAKRPKPLPEQLFEAPPEEECDIFRNPISLPTPGHKIEQTLYSHKGRLVRYFIAYTITSSRGVTREVFSVCSKHGYFHCHTTGHQEKNDRKDVRPITSQVDVQESYDEAYLMVHNHYVAKTGWKSDE